MTRFQIQAWQASPFTCSIFELKSLFTPQSCDTKSHYQRRDCQPAVVTAGNLGNPAFLGQIFASLTSLTARRRFSKIDDMSTMSN